LIGMEIPDKIYPFDKEQAVKDILKTYQEK
jgi:hypothetical protein